MNKLHSENVDYEDICMTRFIWIIIIIASSFCSNNIPAATGPATSRTPLVLSQAEKARLMQSLAPHHANYDPEVHMLREPFHSPGYHTTLKAGFIHSTRASLTYAVALLDTGDALLLKRAEDILRKVISLQDQNPQSKTYGIWSWFLEEPLDKMSPPDWNWADFCGVQLLQAALDHRHRLSADLVPLLDASIQHAARSIQRRNVSLDYTNIAIMGTYVTLVTAELYSINDLGEYALNRLRKFHELVTSQGAFAEYNSPTYSIVALSELGRMKLHVQNKAALLMVDQLYQMVWNDIALHFHPPSRQWAGPHSRSYSTLLKPNVLALIQQSTDNRVQFGASAESITAQRLPLPCPREYEPFFSQLSGTRDIIKTYVKSTNPIIGTTHMEPAFALGSINRGDFWNQRRSLVAYWGTATRPSYLHLRCLRDDYDFAGAQFFSVQTNGTVLGAINFATDGGNTHISLDRIKNSTFTAKDFRLRFECGGDATNATFNLPANLACPVDIHHDGLTFRISVPHAAFGDRQLRWASGKNKDKSWVDVVIHQGEEREFNLSQVQEAAIGFALSISTNMAVMHDVKATTQNDRLALQWNSLKLDIPTKPGKAGLLQSSAKH